MAAAKKKTADAKAARRRLDAALDALAFEEPEADQKAVVQRMWDALSGAIKDASGDVQMLNTALREYFERIVVEDDGRGNIAAEAFLSPAGLIRASRMITDGDFVYDAADVPLPKLLLGAGEQLA